MKKTCSKLFGIDDIVFYPIVKDTIKSYTLDEGVRLTGCRQLEIQYTYSTPDVEESLDSNISIISAKVTGKFTLGSLTSKLLEDINWNLKAQILGVQEDGGDIHIVFYKGSLEVHKCGTTGDIQYVDFTFETVPCVYHKKILDITLHEKPIDLIALNE